MRVERFEDLEVWKQGRELARGVYRAIQSQALSRDRILSDQMRRAAISIVSNISEGFERGTRKQFVEQCYIAKGSAGELRSQVVLAHDVGLIDEKAFVWMHERCERCSRMLSAFIRNLQTTSVRFPGVKIALAAESGERSPRVKASLKTQNGQE